VGTGGGLARAGHGDRFDAAVAGVEYTRFRLFDEAELGSVGEYLYDGREENGDAPLSPFNNDFFGGFRLALNDVEDTEFLAGAIIDVETQTMLVSVEADRRLGDSWEIELEGRLFFNVDDNDPLAGVRDDGYIGLRLARFF